MTDKKQALGEIDIGQVQAERFAASQTRAVEQSKERIVRLGSNRAARRQLPCGPQHGLDFLFGVNVWKPEGPSSSSESGFGNKAFRFKRAQIGTELADDTDPVFVGARLKVFARCRVTFE